VKVSGLTRLSLALARMVGLLVALLAAATFSAILTTRVILSSHDVSVPTLVGRRVPEATMLTNHAGLSLRVEGRRFDPLTPMDRVLSQEPAPGSTLKANRTVRVWLSLGPQRRVIPAVQGSTVRSAQMAFEQAGVPIARTIEVDDAAAEGTVLLQQPAAGDADPAEGGVSLLVSRGPSGLAYVMPDLIGRRADEVLEGLRLAGLKVSDIRYRSYPGLAAGVIIGQNPRPGFRVGRWAALTLEINKETP
jgi:beta-lactam-binding protein with PASTA domain